jgi:hypothetical protein
MPSSGMLRRVALVGTDVFEARSATIIRLTRIGELVTLALSINCHTLQKNNTYSSETSVLTRVTRRNNPEDGILDASNVYSLRRTA